MAKDSAENVVTDREHSRTATRLAKRHDQIAYFYLAGGRSVTVNSKAKSGGVIKGDADGKANNAISSAYA